MGRTPKEIMLPSLEGIKDEALRDVLQQTFDALKENHRYYADDLTTRVITIDVGDTTPDVQGGKVFKTANTAPTSITTFDNAFVDQEITIIFGDANTTIATSGNIILDSALVGVVNGTVRLVYDGTNWREIGRSNRTVNTDITVRVSSNDTTAGYLNGKLVAGGGISFVEGSDGGNEILTISVFTGIIVLWSGAISAIPTGWVICDGNNSTPNLTDRFVIHADADAAGTRNVGATGGSHTNATASHTLITAEIPAHLHAYAYAYNQFYVGTIGGAETDSMRQTTSRNTNNTGGGGGHTHPAATTIPKFYALAYIMKT